MNNIFFSIIIPTLNEINRPYLKNILSSLIEKKHIEIIIVDSSTDDTKLFLKNYNLKVINTLTNSRSIKFKLGTEQATAKYVLLHHPRSIINTDALDYIIKHNLSWGGLTHSFNNNHPFYIFTSWYSNQIRSKLTNIIFLDHCIYFKNNSKIDHNLLFPDIDIFEDTKISKYLYSFFGNCSIVPYYSITSDIRFSKNGKLFQGIMNQILKILFHLKASDKIMNKIYEKGLSLNSKYRR